MMNTVLRLNHKQHHKPIVCTDIIMRNFECVVQVLNIFSNLIFFVFKVSEGIGMKWRVERTSLKEFLF